MISYSDDQIIDLIQENYLNKKVIVSCDKAYYRPLEVNTLLGSSKKAFNKLKWRPKTDLKKLIIEMINEEMK